MLSKIHLKLLSLKDEKYLEFNKKIITDTSYEMIGIRLPLIKQYVKQLLKQDDKVIFKDKYYEEVLLHGLYIGGYKCDFNLKVKMIDEYLDLIDSWGICDSFVASLKFIKKYQKDYYPYIRKYLKSDKEFIQRYALVCLLNHYMNEEYYDEIYKIIKTTKYHGYYSKMAGAWLVSYMLINDFNKAFSFMMENKIDEFVYKKGIQKALDSYRVNEINKKKLRSIKAL